MNNTCFNCRFNGKCNIQKEEHIIGTRSLGKGCKEWKQEEHIDDSSWVRTPLSDMSADLQRAIKNAKIIDDPDIGIVRDAMKPGYKK